MSEGRPGAPVFYERRTYRQRRMRDALRLLPVVGLFAWTLPLLWRAGEEAPRTSAALAYVFGVWALLIVAGGLLARLIGPDTPEGEAGQGASE